MFITTAHLLLLCQHILYTEYSNDGYRGNREPHQETKERRKAGRKGWKTGGRKEGRDGRREGGRKEGRSLLYIFLQFNS